MLLISSLLCGFPRENGDLVSDAVVVRGLQSNWLYGAGLATLELGMEVNMARISDRGAAERKIFPCFGNCTTDIPFTPQYVLY